MNTSSKWILLSFAMGTGVGAGGSGACAPAAWKEEGSQYLWGHLTPGLPPSVAFGAPWHRESFGVCLFLMIFLMFNQRRQLPLSGKVLSPSSAWKGLRSSTVAIV